MGLRFIFMLTRNDRTVGDAAAHLRTALRAGVRHIGFKDVGLPPAELKSLSAAIRSGGAQSYLEVVSLDEASEVASARAAVDIGVNTLLGGVRVEAVSAILRGSGIGYFPFPGRIAGHPSRLEGTIPEIVADASALAAHADVDGLDLLAYRSAVDADALTAAVCAAVGKPVIVAGSIGDRDRIAKVRDAGAAGFTIGTAALDGAYPAEGEVLEEQLRAIQKDVAEVNDHISRFAPQSLAQSFDAIPDAGRARTAGRFNGAEVRLAKIGDGARWRFHPTEDQLFLVHRGALLMKFRDRDEVVGEGEFIVVPRGVDHRPAPRGDVCEVMLLGPGAEASPMT